MLGNVLDATPGQDAEACHDGRAIRNGKNSGESIPIVLFQG